MATYHRLHLADRKAILDRVMSAVVEQVRVTGFVLKGRGASTLLYGLHRPTTDAMEADFDAKRKIDMIRRIRRATQATGVEINEDRWRSTERAERASVSIPFTPTARASAQTLPTQFDSRSRDRNGRTVRGTRSFSVLDRRAECRRELGG